MSIFKLKDCTDEQIAAFWAWFQTNEAKLTEKDSNKRVHALKAAQEKLKELFPSSPEAVSLTTMPRGGRWELDVSYGGGANAKKTACRLRVMMPSSLQGKWRMEVSD
jgi:hypothetical protein